MADTIDILGKPVKKPVVIGAGVGVIVLVAVVVHRNKTAAAAAAAAAVPADPGATSADSTQVDPATGLAEGSPEDLSALAGQSSGYYNTQSSGGYDYATGTTANPTGFTNNAQWAQAAESYITGGSGAGASDPVGNALGKYITGGQVTSDQENIINQAIAFQGYPPVPGPEGYPPNIRQAAPVATGGNTTTKVPDVNGKTAAVATSTLLKAGFKVVKLPVTAQANWTIKNTSPASGVTVAPKSTVQMHLVPPPVPKKK